MCYRDQRKPGALSGPPALGYAQWRKDWVKASNQLAQDRRARDGSVHRADNLIGDASSTRPR